MRYKGNFPSFPGVVFNSLRLDLYAVLLILVSALSALSFQTDNQPFDLKKSLKEASNRTKAGQFVEAEAILRRAIAADDKRSAAKVELAYVLTKQRRLGEAYALVSVVAETEPKNSRALAVLGATMLTGGRFREARVFFFNAIKLNRR